MTKETLSDRIVFNGLNESVAKDWREEDYAVIRRRDVREKIQNAQKRLKEEMTIKGEERTYELSTKVLTKTNHNAINKIFEEEFGEKLTK